MFPNCRLPMKQKPGAVFIPGDSNRCGLFLSETHIKVFSSPMHLEVADQRAYFLKDF
jgi:hypothetical protein